MYLATQRPSVCCIIFLHDINQHEAFMSPSWVETEQLFRHRVVLPMAPWPEGYYLINESKPAAVVETLRLHFNWHEGKVLKTRSNFKKIYIFRRCKRCYTGEKLIVCIHIQQFYTKFGSFIIIKKVFVHTYMHVHHKVVWIYLHIITNIHSLSKTI